MAPNGYPSRSVANGDRSIGSMIEGDRAAMERTVLSGHDSGSVVSTSAASTVWDELEDLKSRIKRLEFTGKLPPSNGMSGFSGSSGERPRTGTTTVTTISSSPRHKLQNDASEHSNDSPLSATHPLLHSALNKSKTVLPPDIVKALEAVAADTLSLAQYVGSTGSPNTSGVSAAMNNADRGIATDRQVRRKVDSMCRSLTELCIALSDGRMPLEDDQSLQVIHQHQLHTPFQSPIPISRADPIERASTALDYRSPAYIGARLDREGNGTPNSASKYDRYSTRRASIQHQSPAGLLSRAEASPSPAPVPHHRIGNRNSMILRQQRGASNVNNDNGVGDTSVDIDTSAPYFRAPSRASTDLGGANHIQRPSALYSSEFVPSSTLNNHNNNSTNQTPLSPRLSHLSPTVNMPHRRHFSSAAASPATRYRGLVSNDAPIPIDPRQQQQQFQYDQQQQQQQQDLQNQQNQSQQQQDISFQNMSGITSRLRTASVGGRNLSSATNNTSINGSGTGMRRATGLLGSRMEHNNTGLGTGRERERERDSQRDTNPINNNGGIINNNNNNSGGGVGIAAGYRR